MQKAVLYSGLNLDRVLEVVPFAQSIKLATPNDLNFNQCLTFQKCNETSFHILSHGSEFLSAQHGKLKARQNLGGSTHSEWTLIAAKEGGFFIVNKESQKAITIPDGEITLGLVVGLAHFNEWESQRFHFKKV